MRDDINRALKAAVADCDKRRACTLRLIHTAIKDRDQAARDRGLEGIDDAEVAGLLVKMIEQRRESAQTFEAAGRIDLAEQERQEIGIIKSLLPPQLDDSEMRCACAEVVEDIGANGLRDVGRAMAALKQRYPGKMDFGRASCVVKDLLR
ncbi:GatB/YqeY domain-containing protein [Amorphus coralli]|uniref:GatB/YqeY domain-containing protein n=1 Tax=Amorphus coralli TaxID=340680 RepID=UPI00037DF721|nr:GatB/YqeY domain-containing protein [Amorphus coralli]